MMKIHHTGAEERMRQSIAESRLFLCKKIGKARFRYLLIQRGEALFLLVEYKDDERRAESALPLPADPPAAEWLCRRLAAGRITPATLEEACRELAPFDGTAS